MVSGGINMNIDEKYRKAAEIISQAGGTPLPVNDIVIQLLKYVIMEDEVDFIAYFNDKKSQTMEQLKLSSGLSEEEIQKKVTALAKRGVIFNQPNSKGIMVFRLLPLFNVGTFEYTLMGKLEDNDRTKAISSLFTKLFEDMKIMVEKNYDLVIPMHMTAPPVDRTVPVFENKPKNEPLKIIINHEMEPAYRRGFALSKS